MLERTITLGQVHHRGVPAPLVEVNDVASIAEHLSTSMKVVLLRCYVEDDRHPINKRELFHTSEYVLEKTKKKFHYLAKREFGDHVLIRAWDRVKLLVPRSPTELPDGSNTVLSVWPPIFLCGDCGRIFHPESSDYKNIQEAGSFPQCHTSGCEGEYAQTPHILQCRVCGSIRQIPDTCYECGETLFLRKESETDIETWRLECEGTPSHTHDFNEYREVYWCAGEDGLIPKDRHQAATGGPGAPRSPRTTVGKGISTPLVHRFPTGDDEPQLADDERLLLACNSHLLTKQSIKNYHAAGHRYQEGGDLYREKEEELVAAGRPHDPQHVMEALERLPVGGKAGEITIDLFRKMRDLTGLRVRSHDFSQNLDKEALMRRADDWLTLVSVKPLGSGRPSDLGQLRRTKPELEPLIQYIHDGLQIAQVRYVESVAIVSGTYGVLRGSVHPIYKGELLDPVRLPLSRIDYDRDQSGRQLYCENSVSELPVIVTKKETEGLVFSLMAGRILEMIAERMPDVWQELTAPEGRDPSDYSEEEARAWLMYACFDERHGDAIRGVSLTAAHTISHAIIHRFSRVSGLRDEDLNEMLFPEFAGFVLYNGLGNPLGMLRRVFEDSLVKLLNEEMVGEMEACDMDPICWNQEEGASCHACLHTAEHVCENFNDALDRKVLVGSQGYWG